MGKKVGKEDIGSRWDGPQRGRLPKEKNREKAKARGFPEVTYKQIACLGGSVSPLWSNSLVAAGKGHWRTKREGERKGLIKAYVMPGTVTSL